MLIHQGYEEGGLKRLYRQRLPLALAFGAIVGAGVFFYWPDDLPWWGGLWAVALGLVVVGFWRILGYFLLMLGVVFGLAGGQVEQRGVDWEVAMHKPHWVVGEVADLQIGKAEGRSVATLRDVRVYQVAGLARLDEVKLSVWDSQLADGEQVVSVGDTVAAPVVFLPPQGPIYRGQRDGRIWFYMAPQRLWASVRGKIEITHSAKLECGWLAAGMGRVEALRQQIGQHTQHLAGGALAALLMGDQRLVEPAVREAYRAAGLSHLLAISGMQLTLVGLGVFWLIRRGAAFFPALILRVDVKFWAAVVGLMAAGAYTLLAGAGVSVVRSLVMVALVMGAVLVGRVRDALRAWCVAVVVILVLNPVMVVAAGFQLSVAAVLALILWAERERMFENWARWGWGVKLREIALSSLVAGAATAPILAWQFGQFSSVGLVANMVAIPLMVLATYLGMAALVLWPLGLQGLVLPLMAGLVKGVNGWAVWLAEVQHVLHPSFYLTGWWVVFVAGMSGIGLGLVWYRLWGWFGVVSVLLVGGIGVGSRMQPPLELAVWDKGAVGVRCDAKQVCRIAWAKDVVRAERLATLAGVLLVTGTEVVPAKPDARLVAQLPAGEWNWAELRGGKWQVGLPRCGRVWENVAEECQRGWWKS